MTSEWLSLILPTRNNLFGRRPSQCIHWKHKQCRRCREYWELVSGVSLSLFALVLLENNGFADQRFSLVGWPRTIILIVWGLGWINKIVSELLKKTIILVDFNWTFDRICSVFTRRVIGSNFVIIPQSCRSNFAPLFPLWMSGMTCIYLLDLIEASRRSIVWNIYSEAIGAKRLCGNVFVYIFQDEMETVMLAL